MKNLRIYVVLTTFGLACLAPTFAPTGAEAKAKSKSVKKGKSAAKKVATQPSAPATVSEVVRNFSCTGMAPGLPSTERTVTGTVDKNGLRDVSVIKMGQVLFTTPSPELNDEFLVGKSDRYFNYYLNKLPPLGTTPPADPFTEFFHLNIPVALAPGKEFKPTLVIYKYKASGPNAEGVYTWSSTKIDSYETTCTFS